MNLSKFWQPSKNIVQKLTRLTFVQGVRRSSNRKKSLGVGKLSRTPSLRPRQSSCARRLSSITSKLPEMSTTYIYTRILKHVREQLVKKVANQKETAKQELN